MPKLRIKRIKFLVLGFNFAFLALCFTRVFASAQEVSSSELINNAQYHDGKEVIYAGEVIGDIMVRGEYAWMNVHDSRNAIGIWLPSSLTKTILHTGNYKEKGDWIEITGVFQHICKQHGGDLDIHATSIKNINSGYSIPHIFNRGRMKKAAILLAVLVLVWILRHLIKR
jgi:hypothetical protein